MLRNTGAPPPLRHVFRTFSARCQNPHTRYNTGEIPTDLTTAPPKTEPQPAERLTDAAPNVRRAVRETALRVLYAMDAGKRPVEEVLEDAAAASPDLDERGRAFLRHLVGGTLEHRDAIDAQLSRLATDFPTKRQAVVDRNILRLAAGEIAFHLSDAPPGAVVNEAVELAKKYSTKDSGRFVNGVLGALVREQTGVHVSAPPEALEDGDTETAAENSTESEPFAPDADTPSP